MICKNLKELEKELYKRINTALDTEVADTIKEVMTDHIIRDVYDAWEPQAYMRRYNQSGNDIGSPFDDTDNIGLLGQENIISTIDGDGNLFVQNMTLGSRYYYDATGWHISKNAEKPIAGVIETGRGYDVLGNATPRPFIQNTHDDLEQNHYHTEAMKRSLKKQGLEVK